MYAYLILLAGPTLKVKPDHPISSQQILQTNENGKQNSSPEFILGKTEIYKKIHFFFPPQSCKPLALNLPGVKLGLNSC